MAKKRKGCNCKKELSKVLAQHNTELESNLFDENTIFIATEKIESRKRGKAKSVIAAYCPFCGKKIPEGISPFK